jgi:hypothetical protein
LRIAVGGSGRGELSDLLGDGLVDQDELEGFLGQVAAGNQPFVVLLDQQRADQADDRGPVGALLCQAREGAGLVRACSSATMAR